MFGYPVYIYKLECTKTGRVYIGKTYSPERRHKHHLFMLRAKKHVIEEMQADFDKYGESSFVFTVLETVKREPVNGQALFSDALREKQTMLEYRSYLPEFGYNYKDRYFYLTRNGVTRCLVET